MNKQQLASRVWEMANSLRGKVSASAYKDYMLGFIFYKYLSDKQVKYMKDKLDMDDDDIKSLKEKDAKVVNNIKSNIGYFIEYKNLFATWVNKISSQSKNSTTLDISDVSKALSAFKVNIDNNFKSVYCTTNSDKNDDIFSTLSGGLNDLGSDDANRSKQIRELVNLVNTIPVNSREEYDMLGFIYEFLLKNFAANAGKAGEFYTPHEASFVMSEIIADHLKDRENISIYDPTSGSGSLLINIGKSIQKHINKCSIKYYAQELVHDTYNLTKMNLIMRNVSPNNIIVRYGDTLKDDWPYFDDNDKEHTYEPLFVDACCSNPPYSQAWDITNKEVDPRFAEYGVAPKSKADMAFLLHNLYHLRPDGIMTIVLPHGVLFRGGEEENIRTNLIEKGNIHAIIGLPSNMFFGTGIPTIIMVLRKKRNEDDILFVDASKGFMKEGNKNKLRPKDVKKIVETVIERKTIEKYSRVVPKEEIVKNKYNLNISMYVDSNEEPDLYDIYATMNGGVPNEEINKLDDYFSVFPSVKDELYEKENESYSQTKATDIESAINSNKEIIKYNNNAIEKLEKIPDYFRKNIIKNRQDVDITKLERSLYGLTIDLLGDTPLLDKYDLYEEVSEANNRIVLDLEVIKEDGDDAMRQVDDVIKLEKKKKSNEITEKVIGREGRIFKFELVEEVYFSEELKEIKKFTEKKESLIAEKNELIDSIDPNDKMEILKDNDDEEESDNEDTIDTKKLNKLIANIKKDIKKGAEYEEGEFYDVIWKIGEIISKIKIVSKNLNDAKTKLEKEVEKKINCLTDEECEFLLYKKWCEPFIDGLKETIYLPVSQFIEKNEHLVKKYELTFKELEKQIESNSNELKSLLKELDGEEFDIKGINDFINIL